VARRTLRMDQNAGGKQCKGTGLPGHAQSCEAKAQVSRIGGGII
jgi:hypothetical protein